MFFPLIAALAVSVFVIGLVVGLMLSARVPHAPAPAAQVLPSKGFSGSLDELSIASVLSMLENERKTGILQVQIDQTSGLFSCVQGRLVVARLEVRELITGQAAVMELVKQRGGMFQFVPQEVTGEPMERSITQLLMEGVQRLDEAKKS